jgi:hypothetical protein
MAWSAPWRVQFVSAVATTLMFGFRAAFSHFCHWGEVLLPGVPPMNAISPPSGRFSLRIFAFALPTAQ